jgi:hypothetical protein
VGRFIRLLPLLVAAALGLPTAASAAAPQVDVAILGDGDLVAGVEIRLPVEMTCDPLQPSPFGPAFATLSVTIQQRAGRGITGGFGGVTPICDGTPHTYVVGVRPSFPGTLAFHGGRALATVAGMACTFDPVTFRQECTTKQISQEIHIRG